MSEGWRAEIFLFGYKVWSHKTVLRKEGEMVFRFNILLGKREEKLPTKRLSELSSPGSFAFADGC